MLCVTLGNIQSDTSVIFVGFPLTTPQVKSLQSMQKKRCINMNTILSIEVPKAELITHLLAHGKLSNQSNDNLKVIKARITVYDVLPSWIYKSQDTNI